MVTASNVFNRFRNNTVMSGSESYIQKYIRAKRRREAAPQCLFGVPSQAEIDEYLAQQNAQQSDTNNQVLDKYDLTDVPAHLLLDESPSTSTSEVEETSTTTTSTATTSFSSNDSASSSSAADNKFQPRIITPDNPPPTTNLFSPIEKVESVSSVYWQTPKRRRSSESHVTSTPETKSAEVESSKPTAFASLSQNEEEDSN